MSQNSEHSGMRLLKQGGWSLGRALLGRMGVCLVLLALNLGFTALLFFRFRDLIAPATALTTLLVAGVVLWLFSSPIDPTAKLTWLALLAIAPVMGSLFLLYTQLDFGHRKLRQRSLETKGAVQAALGAAEPAELAPGPAGLARYLGAAAGARVYRGCHTEYFSLGEEMLPALLRELEGATSSIWMEYFILAEGQMWGAILEVLAQKAAQGLDVRVLYDGTCEFALLPRDYPARLKKLGIQCKVFSPATPFVSTHYNYRDHRKITVIDGKVAFTGGVNLSDEYINIGSRFGHWKDTGLMVKGPAAAGFGALFLENWALVDKSAPADLPETPPAGEAPGFVIPYGDGPVDGHKVGERVYMDLLARATDRVDIMTPYLILDGELETAIRFAAQRGVKVRLLLPGIPDKAIPYALALGYCPALLEAGVEIFTYTPGFVHAKSMTVDGREAVIGTVNMDYRSLYHHFECAAWLVGCDCIADMEADMEAALARSEKLTKERLRARPWHQKLLGSIMRVIAPLL